MTPISARHTRMPWQLLENPRGAEVIASLRVLVCLARVQRELSAEERSVLEDLCENMMMPGCPELQQLMNENINLDEQLRKITTDDGRDRAYNAAYCLAHVDGTTSPAQIECLDRIRAGLHISEEKASLLGRIYADARDWLVPDAVNPIALPNRRAAAIDDMILKYSIINAIPGAIAIPVLSVLGDLLVVSSQLKMIRDIGQCWGHKVDKQAAHSIMAGAVGATGLRLGVHTVLNVIPIFGSAFGAASAFVTTWALGKVANRYFESGGKLDAQDLRALYGNAKEEARQVYERHKTLIATKIHRGGTAATHAEEQDHASSHRN